VIEQWIATNERTILDGVKRAAMRTKFETTSIKLFYKVIPVHPEVKNQQAMRREIRAIVQEQIPVKTVQKKSIVQTITSFFTKAASHVVQRLVPVTVNEMNVQGRQANPKDYHPP
jgi:hypothetical protein